MYFVKGQPRAGVGDFEFSGRFAVCRGKADGYAGRVYHARDRAGCDGIHGILQNLSYKNRGRAVEIMGRRSIIPPMLTWNL